MSEARTAERPRVLLIDDAEDYREALRVRLTATGFAVTTAGSAQHGLVAAANQTFDLILLDMLMPGKGGIVTLQELRAQPGTQHTPVILLTGVAAEGHWESLPHGTDPNAFVMGKALDYTVLVRRMREVLSKPTGPDAEATGG